ncbi:MAG: phosphoribosylformylglycinamidine synthase subunit PurS [Dehalococcoidia bacterium]|nr:MAG: phosphoribosylformylglycinamidine synthase subunit PurS [Dehalococcoidia bacterium]
MFCLKPTVNDPQGLTIARALGRLGFEQLMLCGRGKYFEVQIQRSDEATPEQDVKAMCEKLLSNPVIETFTYELELV